MTESFEEMDMSVGLLGHVIYSRYNIFWGYIKSKDCLETNIQRIIVDIKPVLQNRVQNLTKSSVQTLNGLETNKSKPCLFY